MENNATSSKKSSNNNSSNSTTTSSSNFMLMELLEKYFNQNPWYDLTNLDELIKLTGLDEASLRVITIKITNKRV